MLTIDLLGVPTQHREVQGFESKLFLSYFPRFVCKEGGIESGFRHVGPENYATRLLQITGVGKNIAIRQVPLTPTSLNNSDVFILDAGLVITQFNGEKANGQEKHKAMEYCQALEGQRKTAKTNVIGKI